MSVSQSPSISVAVEVSFLLEFAELLASSGRHPECRAVYEAAIRLDAGNTARNAFGCYLLKMEQFTEACGQFRQIDLQAGAEQDQKLLGVAANNLAAAYRSMGHSEDAAIWQQISIGASSCAHDAESAYEELACDLSNRACDAILAGDWDLAEGLLWHSVLIEKRFGSREGEASDWGNLGVLYRLTGNMLRAVRCLRRAYSLHKGLNDPLGCAKDLLNLAEVFEIQGNGQRACICLRRAAELFDQCRATKSAAYAQAWLRSLNRRRQLLKQTPEWN